MRDILYFAIGFFEEQEAGQATTFEFFERIQRYLRSIGYYGDSPMLSAVYGSSEYAQALSRTGSIFGNIFIVNPQVQITDLDITADRFNEVKFHFNDTPVTASKGLIVGPDYHDYTLRKMKFKPEVKVKKCVRATIITKKPFFENTQKVVTYVFPPGTFRGAE